MDLNDTIGIFGAILAFIALIRPDISNILRRLRNRTEFFPLTRIEIGFSNFGTTVGLAGTLRATRGDQFIHSMTVVVGRAGAVPKRTFLWTVFRTSALQLEIKDLSYASGFVLKRDEARPINIQFSDPLSRSAIEDPLMQLRHEWLDFLNAHRIAPTTKTPQQLQDLFSGRFNSAKAWIQVKAHQALSENFYWEAGDYHLEINIVTWDPKRSFRQKYNFTLTEADCARIRTNFAHAMLEACAIPIPPYNFAYPVISIKS